MRNDLTIIGLVYVYYPKVFIQIKFVYITWTGSEIVRL